MNTETIDSIAVAVELNQYLKLHRALGMALGALEVCMITKDVDQESLGNLIMNIREMVEK